MIIDIHTHLFGKGWVPRGFFHGVARFITHDFAKQGIHESNEAMGDSKGLSRAGLSPEFLKSIQQKFSLWDNPLRDICSKALKTQAKNIMHTPSKSEYINENASMDEAIHQLVMGIHQSLLVTRGNKVIGAIRLTDITKEIFEIIQSCEI